MNADGTNFRNLTQNEANDFRPSWSKDSKSIFFNSKQTGKYQLFTMDLQGNVTQITESEDNQASPSMMHRQNKLAFANYGERMVDICILDLETKVVKKIPHGEGEIMLPSFSPDDKEILFVLMKDGQSRICIMDYATKKQRYLVDF